MFKTEHHQRILQILQRLNSTTLKSCQAYFGGGTLLVLENGEYRESRDIDFICPFGAGYRNLRNLVAEQNHSALFRQTDRLTFPREIQANQYGIRTVVSIDNIPIKFEIVAEGRIALENPSYPQWSPVPCLSQNDRITEKLLANADRWNDDSVEARDLIDLAILRCANPFPVAALAKAEAAYPVQSSLQKAIQRFQSKPDYRDRCYRSLKIDCPRRMIDGLDLLAQDFGLGITDRTFQEQ
jgi:Nucleotidyl transferase AbiEii toxin, Type IV TA system